MTFKFFLVPSNHPPAAYHHEMVAIAEGLRDLGISYYGTLNYWKESETNNYLIEQAPANFDAEVHIYSVYYFNYYKLDIEKTVDYTKINIIIDREDGYYSLFSDKRYSKFDAILKTHYNKNIPYHYYQKNVIPWAFGLSNRIIKSIDESINTKVEDKTYINFRITHHLREMAYEKFNPIISQKYPIDFSSSLSAITGKPFKAEAIKEEQPPYFSEAEKLYQLQTGFRHDTNYYRKLNSSLLTYTFGGYVATKPFLTNRLLHPIHYLYKSIRWGYEQLNLDVSNLVFIYQYDSWRWWEALYANTCPIHMDFEDWGWVLPVMPENKIHYWGVKKLDFEKSANELRQLHRDDILQIGLNGRNWSKQHYNPLATANRLIDLVNKIKIKHDLNLL
ncbi:MAG TPA: hypothetical protein VNG53_08410 [Bacteroidia bacterium]|nr:hypothetical protein [Bacteroidia bacterium]